MSPKADIRLYQNQAVVWSSDKNVIEFSNPKDLDVHSASELCDNLFEKYKDEPKFEHVVVEWLEIMPSSKSRYIHRWTKWKNSNQAFQELQSP